MHRQLELWPISQEASQLPRIWTTLTDQQKKDLVTALADLISKMVSAEATDQTEEGRHER